MKTRKSKTLMKLNAIFFLSLLMLPFVSLTGQDDWTLDYSELEKLQDKNMDYMMQIYRITEDYPAFTYKYNYENGKVKKVTVTGVEDEIDRKRLEVILFDLQSNRNKIKHKRNRIGVFYSVDKNAQPKMDEDEFIDEIRSNLSYPEDAKKWGAEGTVFVKFVVDKNGEIPFITASENIETSQEHLVKALKKEAISAVKKTSGQWEPGEIDGVPVASLAVVPVKFNVKTDPSIRAPIL